jgi:hypothetical protein
MCSTWYVLNYMLIVDVVDYILSCIEGRIYNYNFKFPQFLKINRELGHFKSFIAQHQAKATPSSNTLAKWKIGDSEQWIVLVKHQKRISLRMSTSLPDGQLILPQALGCFTSHFPCKFPTWVPGTVLGDTHHGSPCFL